MDGFFKIGDILMAFVKGANDGLNSAIAESSEYPIIFISPQIDIKLKCCIIKSEKNLLIAPSNPNIVNRYNVRMDETIDIRLKTRPGYP